MVQIVENHAVIEGTLRGRERDANRPGFVRLTVRIAESCRQGEWPDMFARLVGEELTFLAREGSAAATAPDGTVRWRVRMAGPGVAFVED
ncbi:hypothetical protein [Sphingomonas azotifigens]|uniref:hypothetical protein n=1 Tax=Sphingomonas azotifigens TaxID=330920 RepID=UPI0009FD1CC0|nr:hypothetical protein [Sphingomonas azotifigens]